MIGCFQLSERKVDPSKVQSQKWARTGRTYFFELYERNQPFEKRFVMDVQSMYNKIDLVDLEDTPKPSNLNAAKSILLQCVSTSLFLPLSLACLPLYIIGLFIWGRPPIVSPLSRFYKYFIAALTEGKPEEKITFMNRILICTIILDNLVKSPIYGVGWYLDEIFYPSYHKCEIKDPLFFISSPRSGSTQMAQYLDDDSENFLAPMVIETVFPYIWAWKMIAPILKMIGLKQYFENASLMYGEEMKKRHNSSLFKVDTVEMATALSHMALLSCNLGIQFMKWAFVGSALKDQPVDREIGKYFIEFTDCIMRKVMYHRGLPNQQIFVKTHMLIVARELEKRYDGAKFFTLVRDPVERFRSGINSMKLVSVDGPFKKRLGLFPISWRVARDWMVEAQICYCEDEIIFFNQSEDNTKNKLAISFDTYVNNLAGTLQQVYSFLNIPVTAELLSKAAVLQKTTHDRTKRRASYDPKYNRTLSSLGVDEEKVKEYLSNFINWKKRLE